MVKKGHIADIAGCNEISMLMLVSTSRLTTFNNGDPFNQELMLSSAFDQCVIICHLYCQFCKFDTSKKKKKKKCSSLATEIEAF